jgi:hypothetical protein
MKFYHGTSVAHSKSILGPPTNVNVELGKGELGKGFYLGDSPFLAASRTVGKYGRTNSSVIEFEISMEKILRLNILVINKKEDVKKKWEELKTLNTTNSFEFNVDIVCAPFATIDMNVQYKFESKNSEILVNSIIPKEIYEPI